MLEKGVFQMTISLAPQLEKRLRWKAARTGQDTNTLAEEILSDALGDEVSEDELREEYHQLIDLELKGQLLGPQSDRLRQIRQELDNLDAQSPAAQAMYERLDETGLKLDEMLSILRSLPLAEQAQ